MCECGEFVEVASEDRPVGARCKMCRKTANLRNGTELDGVRIVRRFIAVIDGWILNLPMRAIGALTGLSPGTVRKYWRRLDAMGRRSSRGWTQRERSRSEGRSHRRGR